MAHFPGFEDLAEMVFCKTSGRRKRCDGMGSGKPYQRYLFYQEPGWIAKIMSLDSILSHWRSDPETAPNFSVWQTTPNAPANLQSFPADLPLPWQAHYRCAAFARFIATRHRPGNLPGMAKRLCLPPAQPVVKHSDTTCRC